MARAEPLRAGDLDKQIMLQEPNTVDNGRGGRKTPAGEDPWRNVEAEPLWAQIIALRGDEAVRNSIERAVQLWRVTIRTRAGITTANRLLWGSVALNIKSAAPNERGDGLVMTCESGGAG